MKIYHKVTPDGNERFSLSVEESYNWEEFGQWLEYMGLIPEDFNLINSGPELESIPDCIAIWELCPELKEYYE